jgi:hypothetical protein
MRLRIGEVGDYLCMDCLLVVVIYMIGEGFCKGNISEMAISNG